MRYLHLFHQQVPLADSRPNPISPELWQIPIQSKRLNIAELEKSVHLYFSKGLNLSAQRTYKSVRDQYLKFCPESATAHLPTIESQLSSFLQPFHQAPTSTPVAPVSTTLSQNVPVEYSMWGKKGALLLGIT